jgi:DNA-binding transcriptional ArsR family regulator
MIALRETLDDIDMRLDQYKALVAERKKYARALAVLEGPAREGSGRLQRGSKPRGRPPSNVGPERLAEYEQAIREFAAEQEEFRQVDIRAVTGATSNVMTRAFEQLRQTNVIRVARQEGNSKYYRLTRAALNGETKPAPKQRTKRTSDTRIQDKILPERLEDIRATIREFSATQNNDEFRQIDIRNITGYSSNTTSRGFDQLMQMGLVRHTRDEGNNRYYELTARGRK